MQVYDSETGRAREALSLDRIRSHFRSNIIGYLALLVLGGTAAALPGKNTVFSDDIVSGEVKKVDIGRNAVTAAKIGNGEVSSRHIKSDAVNGARVIDGSLTGAELAADSLTSAHVNFVRGADIDEGTLGEVPSAIAGGVGRMAQGGSCDPETESYVSCGSLTIDLPAQGRVFVHGYGNGFPEPSFSEGFADCAIFTSATGGFPSVVRVNTDNTSAGEFGISLVTGPLGPGLVSFEIHCNEVGADIHFQNVGLSVVQIGPS